MGAPALGERAWREMFCPSHSRPRLRGPKPASFGPASARDRACRARPANASAGPAVRARHCRLTPRGRGAVRARADGHARPAPRAQVRPPALAAHAAPRVCVSRRTLITVALNVLARPRDHSAAPPPPPPAAALGGVGWAEARPGGGAGGSTVCSRSRPARCRPRRRRPGARNAPPPPSPAQPLPPPAPARSAAAPCTGCGHTSSI
jgi:hypothetical protein